ncbi:MAG: hypothetical protein IJA80_05285 [Clostridia bacterium]|nr:hypothetical protein [Clostridia bacterium]
MKKRFLEDPNLPENKVTTVYADVDDIALKNAFNDLSIKVINIVENQFLDTPVCRHADILANYIGKSTFLSDKHQIELCKFIEDNNGKSVIIENIKSPYPNDCLLNFADIGDYIICNKSILTKEIIDLLPKKAIIDVKQGYSKCSVCICKSNTIITDDISVYNAVLQYDNINSLLVEKGSVHINKYDYGFIGGCCGLIDKNTLLFNGDLTLHSDFDKIKKFMYDNDVNYIDIKGKPLTDIGSIIPIMEIDGD